MSCVPASLPDAEDSKQRHESAKCYAGNKVCENEFLVIVADGKYKAGRLCRML